LCKKPKAFGRKRSPHNYKLRNIEKADVQSGEERGEDDMKNQCRDFTQNP
jgi:hypothetical protein